MPGQPFPLTGMLFMSEQSELQAFSIRACREHSMPRQLLSLTGILRHAWAKKLIGTSGALCVWPKLVGTSRALCVWPILPFSC